LTWGRDTNGLFDYESHAYTKNIIKLEDDSNLFRVGEKLSTTSSETSQQLTSIHKTNKNFYISPESFSSTIQQKPWLVVKSITPSEYLLSQGDKLKVGKVSLKIKEISGFRQSDNKKSSIHSKSLINGGAGSTSKTSKNFKALELKETEGTCRICLCDESSPSDPLISLCICSGTMGTTHLNCLKSWLSSKMIQNIHKNIKIYEWRSFHCELCSFKYPSKVNLHGSLIDLITIQKPLTNFIVIRSGVKSSRLLHVISLENRKVLKFGRSHDCDLKFKDISVSRSHALVNIKSSGLFLQDLNSKFGTVVRLRKNLIIDQDFPLKLQIGRTLLKFSINRPWNLFSCFSSCGKDRDSDEDFKSFPGNSEIFSGC
jgi:hypothetical protein